ncbi:FeoA family protein [Actinopolyspora mortivallis]|uniref:FeoA family protein n=1 Tax=Actinopolyspora mortivallis TaxID=33906 RepID=UPI000365FEF6|nr:FeoA family protein [Actinopolyspora mortivallis]
MNTTLDRLSPGETATVTALDVEGPQRRRLMDLGILPGTRIRAERSSPLGDPTAYLVRGSLLVLRRNHAGRIHVDRHQG